jgi:hypothetical protein
VGAAVMILDLLARPPLPLWRPRPNQTRGTAAGKRRHGHRRGGARGAGVGAWESEIVRSVAEGPQLPFNPFAKDLEQGDAAAAAAAATVAVVATRERQAGAERRRKSEGAGSDSISGSREYSSGIGFPAIHMFASASQLQRGLGRRRSRCGAITRIRTRTGTGTGRTFLERREVVTTTLVKRSYSAEVWVYRCRVAAVMSALILLNALIVALVVIRSTNA